MTFSNNNNLDLRGPYYSFSIGHPFSFFKEVPVVSAFMLALGTLSDDNVKDLAAQYPIGLRLYHLFFENPCSKNNFWS